MPRGLRSSRSRDQPKVSLTKRFPLLRKRSIIRPPNHLPQRTLLSVAFSTPPIKQKAFTLSVIRGWILMITWNQPLRMVPWYTLLLLTHCLRGKYWGEMDFLSVLWYHRTRMVIPSKIAGSPRAFPTSPYSYTVSLSIGSVFFFSYQCPGQWKRHVFLHWH